MKKLLIAFFLTLVVITAQAEDVETVEMYGVSFVSSSGVQPSTSEATLTYWDDGTICVKVGNRMRNYKKYNSNRIYGDNIPSGCNAYRCYQYYEPGRSSNQDNYLLVSYDKKAVREVLYSNLGFGWQFICYTEYHTTPSPSPSHSPSPGYAPTPSPSPNYNSTTPSQGRTCAGCGGTGVCTMCQGKGGYYTNSGTYTGSGSKTWHQCSSCHGSGKCGVCYGQGTIR